MNEEERFEIELNQEDVQNLINCYEKDIEYIKQLEQENKELKEQLELNDCKTIYNQFVNYKNWYFDYVDKYEKTKQENQQLHNKIDKAIEYLKDRIQVLEVSYSYDKNDEYLNAKLFGGKKELEMLLNEVLKDSDVDV